MIEDDPLMEVVYANQISNMVQNVDVYYKSYMSDESINAIIDYARRTGAPLPKIDNETIRNQPDLLLTLVRYWTVRETLNLMMGLYGDK